MLMREGVHPETRRPPFTLGWDIVGVVDQLGDNVSSFQTGDRVAALPIVGGYAEYICLPQDELVSVPSGLDPSEAVALVLNYTTAYQMMHRTVQVEAGRRALIHSASGGVGTALLQLGRLAQLEMYGTTSSSKAAFVSSLGATPIDYKAADFVEEIFRLNTDGVDVVLDGIGGPHLWRSYQTLRKRGRVVAYGLTSSLKTGSLAAGRRFRLRGVGIITLYMLAAALRPGGKRIVLYSIQNLMRLRRDWFREDLTTLFDLLAHQKIKPIIAARFPLAEARRAHELLATSSVAGKIVLTRES
jgi:NADPH2:quinone reductase